MTFAESQTRLKMEDDARELLPDGSYTWLLRGGYHVNKAFNSTCHGCGSASGSFNPDCLELADPAA